MTPNPTLRPFVLGALMFVMVLASWPGRSVADQGPQAAPAAVPATR